MMPIYDYECTACGKIHERIESAGDMSMKPCDKCGKDSIRIISASGQYCGNEDAAWLRSVTDVIDKGTSNEAAKAFIVNPTRSNYKAWMASEGLRPMENGERPSRPKEPSIEKIRGEVWNKYQERHRISL